MEHARTIEISRRLIDTNGFMVRKKVICIEDDRETAALIAEELTDRGYEVILAYSGEEGLAAIRRADPDLVISDICMPLMSGFEVLERLTIHLPCRRSIPPFIFLTAMTDRDFRLKGRKLGADDYITKPVDFDRLARIIIGQLATVRPADPREEWGITPSRGPPWCLA